MLLIDRGADTTTPGGVLRSLVSYAVKHNLVVDKLGGINLSDDGNVIHEIKGDDTLLKSKALIGDVDSMRAILKTGVEVNFKDMNGDTVLACVLIIETIHTQWKLLRFFFSLELMLIPRMTDGRHLLS